MCFIIRSRC